MYCMLNNDYLCYFFLWLILLYVKKFSNMLTNFITEHSDFVNKILLNIKYVKYTAYKFQIICVYVHKIARKKYY